MTPNHSICFLYFGRYKENSVFNITVFKQEQVTKDISQSIQPQQPIQPLVESSVQDRIQWEVTLTEVNWFESYLILCLHPLLKKGFPRRSFYDGRDANILKIHAMFETAIRRQCYSNPS